MSANLPGQRLPSIQWLEGHIDNWDANAVAIGLNSASVLSLTADIASARDAFTTAQEIRAESKAKTADYYAKTKAMHDNAAVMVQAIKAFANAAPTPSAVYALAQISAPDPASPLAPPSRPINIDYRILGDGAVRLTWAATGPSGTMYNVSRKLPSETEFSFVGQGDSSNKSFTDQTLPAGSANASYRVQGFYGPHIGQVSLTFTVYFGISQAAQSQAA